MIINRVSFITATVVLITSSIFGQGNTRIWNGNLVESDSDYPWTAAIFSVYPGNEGQYCGGTLIAPTWVLTASHCVDEADEDDPEDIEISLGSVDYDGPNAITFEVEEIIMHPDFVLQPNEYDVALIKLDTTATAYNIPHLPLIFDSDHCESGDTGTLIGWGDHPNPPPDDSLMFANFTIRSDSYCENLMDFSPGDDDMFLFSCIAGDGTDPIISDSDSGGPFIVQTGDDDFPYTLAGIGNLGGVYTHDDTTYYLSRFTRVDSLVSWIYDNIDPVNVRFANEDPSENDLGGTLNIENFVHEITSDDTIPIPELNELTIFTDSQIQNLKQHWMWNSSGDEYFLSHDVSFDDDDEDVAVFKATNNIDFDSSIGDSGELLFFKDPWYKDANDYQPDSLFSLDDIAPSDNYDVFLNQNPNYQTDLPIYQVCAKEHYADTGAIFEFDYWGGTSVDYDTTTNICAEVVFEASTSIAKAFYDTISYNSVLTLDEDLTIPAGAEYSLGGSFRIDIEEGSTLKFDGEVDNPISLQPSSSANGWDGIRVKDSSNVKLIYTKVIGADIGLDIQSDNENIHDIVNNTFAFCDTAIKIHEDDFDDLDITNNILHQNDVGIELKFYDGSSTGVGSELELKNNIFYDNTTTYIEEHDCTTNCYSSSGLLYENPDLKDVDEATEKYDCTLQWVSPCINGGASGMTADPDNTVIDIGAYYFHITLGDLNADTSWDVSDVTVLQGYILEPDPATPTSTMLDIGDTNTDTDIDVLDIVVLVTCIQNNDCDELERTTPLSGSANLLAYQPESLDRSEGEAIVISIESDVPVYGLQFDLEFETSEYDLYNIEQTDATEGFELEYRDYGDGTVRVLSYSLEAESIPTGINEVLIMNLNGLERGESNISYTVVNAKVSDEHGNNLLLSGNDPANTAVPTSFALHQAYPNPFNPETTIRYDLPVEADINITVYDIMGRPVIELVNSHMSPGYHRVTWNAKNNASGVYFIKLQTPGYTQTQKVMLVK